jgi:hypothetical protein
MRTPPARWPQTICRTSKSTCSCVGRAGPGWLRRRRSRGRNSGRRYGAHPLAEPQKKYVIEAQQNDRAEHTMRRVPTIPEPRAAIIADRERAHYLNIRRAHQGGSHAYSPVVPYYCAFLAFQRAFRAREFFPAAAPSGAPQPLAASTAALYTAPVPRCTSPVRHRLTARVSR